MNRARMFLFVSIASSACAPASPTVEPATTSGGESQPEQTAETTEATTETTVAPAGEEASVATPEDLGTFSPSVRARLEVLPALPVAPSASVVTITLFDASLICGFLDQHVRHGGTVAAACPDGSPVVLGGECNPASVLALRHTLGDACAVRFGDYLACEIAARETPCAVGFMRADLPECEAVNACLATQLPPG